jgi:dihydropyrimidinase
MSLLLKNGRLVTTEEVNKRDILIEDEKIKAIKENFDPEEISKECQIIDLKEKYVFPGIIDSHTHYHIKSPEITTADDFYSGTVSAAFGGVTTFIDYSDQIKGHSLFEAIRNRQEEAEGETVIDFSLHQIVYSLYPEIKEELKQLKENNIISSLKILTTYKKYGIMLEEESWEKLFKVARDLKLLVTVHAEDDKLIEKIKDGYQNCNTFPPYFHPILRPPETEYRAILEVGNLANLLDMPVYIVHLSSKKGYNAIKEIKRRGGNIFVETTPHYLLLINDLLKKEKAQKYFMTPPLREGEDNEALWLGIKNKDINVIATDHCAFTIEQKLSTNNCLEILAGIPGSETLLPLIYTAGVKSGRFDVKTLVALLSTNPAKIFGLYPQKGSLNPGTDADIVVFDQDKKVIISDLQQHSAAGYTAYAGMEVTGYPVITILRGNVIVKDDIFYGEKGMGKFVKAKESILY